MIEYPKIETLYDRDEKTFKVDTTRVRRPEFLLPRSWLVTEKIDGMNARIELTGRGTFDLSGRTDKSTLTEDQDLVLSAIAIRALNYFGGEPHPVVLFGELYGPKIQSGGWYRNDIAFRLFDVKIGDWWLNWDNVVDVALRIGVETVPVIAEGMPLEAVLAYVRSPSVVATLDGGDIYRNQEGIVARTDPLLLDRSGDRVIWKLKGKDLA